MNESKSILTSKTAIVAALWSIALTVFPWLRDWASANPVEAGYVVSLMMVALRMITKSKVHLIKK